MISRKITGTGASGDFDRVADGGAPALDFTDVGLDSTVRLSLTRIEAGFDTLVATATTRRTKIAASLSVLAPVAMGCGISRRPGIAPAPAR
jgi:hypothetical protein